MLFTIDFVDKYDEIKKRFEFNLPKYKDLGGLLEKDLLKLMNDNSIEIYSITHRIKSFDSFYEKIDRKKYKDPLNEIEDICGLRIVCYYLTVCSSGFICFRSHS